MALDSTLENEGFAVLAPESEPPDADESLSIEDALANPDALSVTQDPPAPLGRAPAIDFVQRQFVPNTAGAPLMIYGTDTLAQWVGKALRTRRGENPACDPDFGLDALFEDMLDGGPFDAAAAAEYEGIVERALTVHPAVESIEEWSVDYAPGDDAALASLRVIPTAEGEDPLDLEVTLPIGG
jgi:hypothetical protein